MKKLIKVAADIQPDKILQIGDAIDLPMVSKWTKGREGEYMKTLPQHIAGWRGVLQELRDSVPDAEITWLEGNHDMRLTQYVKDYAPPLSTLEALSIESLFGLKELRVDYAHGPIRIATNTYAVHGHESGGYSGTPQLWESKFAKRYGTHRNTIFGHTHQPFLITRAFGFNGVVEPRFTMNVGSIMNPAHAKYVKDGSVSWTMSFAILRDDGKRVWPELVIANNRSFWVNGIKY